MKVGAMLAAHARRDPDKTAIVCAGESRTFAELDRHSNRIANALLARGFTPGARIVAYVGNSVALVEAFAGIWKAGGVAVPITTWIAGPELRFMVEDCTPFAVIYGPEQADAVDAHLGDKNVTRIFVGDGGPEEAETLAELTEAGAETSPLPLPLMPDDAMISYTSGTTGRPKGAVATHANLAVQTLLTGSTWGINGEDTFLVTTPIAHRTGLGRVLSCFCQGAKVVVLPRFDAAAAIAAIGEHKVTVFGGVPTTARLILEGLADGDPSCDSLRLLLATGEAFPVPLKRRLAERLPNVRLISFYAMTEAGSPAWLSPEEQISHPESVGRPMPGMEIRLVDEQGNDVPVGGDGEIWVRCGEPGRLVIIREYFNRPDANAEAFADGWFRTGDVGRFDADGYLYIVDRVKDMILSAGLNIYSREVEQALEEHPAVAEAAVVAGPDAGYGECVVAFVSVRNGHKTDADALIGHCRERIASYKKPKHVFFMDSLPRNAGGKVRKPDLRDAAREALGG